MCLFDLYLILVRKIQRPKRPQNIPLSSRDFYKFPNPAKRRTEMADRAHRERPLQTNPFWKSVNERERTNKTSNVALAFPIGSMGKEGTGMENIYINDSGIYVLLPERNCHTGVHPPRAMLAPVLGKINCTLFSGKSIGWGQKGKSACPKYDALQTHFSEREAEREREREL